MIRNDIMAPRQEVTGAFRSLSGVASVQRHLDNADGGVGQRRRELRDFCRRLHGWSAEQAGLVDETTDALLGGIERCAVIPLRADGDLVPIAYALHRKLFGPDRPFILCDPRRNERNGSARSTANRQTSASALKAAAGGSVCIRADHLPTDYELLAPSRRMRSGTQLFVCLSSDDPVIDVLCPPIRITSLAHRTDLERLLDEYLADTTRALGVSEMRLSRPAREALLGRVTTLAELEKVVTRVVVLKAMPSVSAAAQRLGMATVSLSRWASRRGLLSIMNEVEWVQRVDVVEPRGCE